MRYNVEALARHILPIICPFKGLVQRFNFPVLSIVRTVQLKERD